VIYKAFRAICVDKVACGTYMPRLTSPALRRRRN